MQHAAAFFFTLQGAQRRNSLSDEWSMEQTMAGRIVNLGNLKKAYRYCKKNGVMSAYYASMERVQQKKQGYERRVLTEQEMEKQKSAVWEKPEKFSILVPAYETDTKHFHEMIDSVLSQTYPEFELIIADASPTDKLTKEMECYEDNRIRYVRLEENKGISENTNAALAVATGSYIALLDHDDTLEADALYRMMEAIRDCREHRGIEPKMLYSDEDKGNGDMSEFYEPHYKVAFNLDLLLSNNYICHFLVMKSSLMKELKFRKEYDGAQDHDLVLRAAGKLVDNRRAIVHVPYVVYHLRCHTGSTAENPQSKMYAYESGRRAVEDFCNSQGWKVQVTHTKHLGFFRVEYSGGILNQRSDVAAVGGRIIAGGKIAGGAYTEKGEVLYLGLNRHFSGYMHRAVLQQGVAAVDVRKMVVRKELQSILEKIQKEESDVKEISLRFGREAAALGYGILWDPFLET